jgi:toxin FitB
MIILDTNVISELMRRRPAPQVMEWANRLRPRDLVLTSVTVFELQAGIEKLKPGKRRIELDGSLRWAFDELLGSRILPFDRSAAAAAAQYVYRGRSQGFVPQTLDAQIAGIAIARRIPIATRNVSDFELIDEVKVINPWMA